MNSLEEDALFEEWGWFKDLIKRQWEGPHGHKIPFDTVMQLTVDLDGETQLTNYIKVYGKRKDS